MCDSKYDFNITHMNNVAVTNFQTYLQIPSVYPNVKYGKIFSRLFITHLITFTIYIFDFIKKFLNIFFKY